MEQSLPTKFERTNSGTSRGHDQSIVLIVAPQNHNGEIKEISDERQQRTDHGADLESKEKMYLRPELDDDDQLINKNKFRCPKVPPRLRNSERSKDYYDPNVVSFGPYHHGKAELQVIQTIKTKVMRKFIIGHEKPIKDLNNKVLELNVHTRKCYVDGSTDAYDDEALAEMMLQDGCFILLLIESRISIMQNKKDWLSDIASMIFDHLGILEEKYLYQDLLLLENQIPYEVLNVLMSNIYKEEKGLTMIKSYLYRIYWRKFQTEDTRDEDEEEPLHLLGLLNTLISKRGDHVKTVPKNEKHWDVTRYLQSFGSVSDLQAKGIKFKPSKSISLRDVEFRSGFFTGELKLPPLVLFSNSQACYTNLIAFEMCASNIDPTVTSYISFMNSLIANPEDVKALKSKRIILHDLSSDEDVFKMFKEISTTKYPQNRSIYQGVRQDIERHYNNKKKIWIAEIHHKYFSKPWALIGLIFVVVGLILTFLSTFNSFKSKTHQVHGNLFAGTS